MLAKFLKWLNPCKHVFVSKDLKLTGIKPKEAPKTKGYKEWCDYLRNMYTEEAYTKRVVWPCSKCEEVFYAHCGLDIGPVYGEIKRVPPGNRNHI